MTLTAVVADDSVLLREGICRLLEDESISVLGQAGDGTALLDLVASHRPNIAIVDIRMPPDYRTEGLKAAAAIRSTFPATSVLLLSQYLDTENALDLLRNDTGGVGYLLKDRSPISTHLLPRCGGWRQATPRSIRSSFPRFWGVRDEVGSRSTTSPPGNVTSSN